MFLGCTATYYYAEPSVHAKRTRYNIAVSSFGNLNLQGKTFIITPGDSAIHKNDVEFQEYANYVAQALETDGAFEIDESEPADLLIFITYGMTDESYSETVPIPIWGQTGISSISTTSKSSVATYNTASRIGNTVNGSGQGNATSNSTVKVNPTYGVTGYASVERKVNLFRRFLNIYAFDNMPNNEISMLWKTNLISDGTSSDFRAVLPAMAFCSIGFNGKSSGEIKQFKVFEDQQNFLDWKDRRQPDPNVVSYPKFHHSNVGPSSIVIKKILALNNETIVDFIAFTPSFRIVSNISLQVGDTLYQVRRSEGIMLNESVVIPENGKLEFRLFFPAVPTNTDFINITEPVRGGWNWYGVSIRNK